ncbi:unnamed protein product [Caenorhabditis brenneri]
MWSPTSRNNTGERKVWVSSENFPTVSALSQTLTVFLESADDEHKRKLGEGDLWNILNLEESAVYFICVGILQTPSANRYESSVDQQEYGYGFDETNSQN